MTISTLFQTTRVFTTQARIARAINLYLGGASLQLIADKFDTTMQSVRNALSINGVAIRGRGRPSSS